MRERKMVRKRVGLYSGSPLEALSGGPLGLSTLQGTQALSWPNHQKSRAGMREGQGQPSNIIYYSYFKLTLWLCWAEGQAGSRGSGLEK